MPTVRPLHLQNPDPLCSGPSSMPLPRTTPPPHCFVALSTAHITADTLGTELSRSLPCPPPPHRARHLVGARCLSGEGRDEWSGKGDPERLGKLCGAVPGSGARRPGSCSHHCESRKGRGGRMGRWWGQQPLLPRCLHDAFGFLMIARLWRCTMASGN